MKRVEYDKAIVMRKLGYSICKISNKLKVSRSSVSDWVRDVKLTDKQKLNLISRVGADFSRLRQINKDRGDKRRLASRLVGEVDAREKKWLHVAGCMLYWAEGHKKNNLHSIRFGNSDPLMMKLFLKFLRECFNVEDNHITVYINCYTDIHTLKEIEKYWISILGLPLSCLRKTMVNKISSASLGKRKAFSEFGTCRICVNKTEIIQRIYGAINFYSHLI